MSPYTGASDASLPARVKALPADKRRAWVGAWLDEYQQCLDDGDDAGRLRDERRDNQLCAGPARLRGLEE